MHQKIITTRNFAVCRLAGLALSFFFYAAPSLAETEANSFSSKIEAPVRISVHQPFPGFWNNLKKLDDASGFIRFSDEWYSFWEADVWVYFLSSVEDVQNLPEVPKKVLALGSKRDPTDFGQRLDVKFKGEREIMFQFFFTDKFSDSGDWACKSAVTVLNGIRGVKYETQQIDDFVECDR